jgi:hypothetical protein
VVEITRSKREIESLIGVPVDSFSYPYAFPEEDKAFTEYLRAELIRCGYQTSVTTVIGRVGLGNDRHFMKRIPINEADDLLLFEAKLRGGYNWLHGLQYLSKRIFP